MIGLVFTELTDDLCRTNGGLLISVLSVAAPKGGLISTLTDLSNKIFTSERCEILDELFLLVIELFPLISCAEPLPSPTVATSAALSDSGSLTLAAVSPPTGVSALVFFDFPLMIVSSVSVYLY